MYIEGLYWNNLIGDTDDSLTLLDYLADKGREDLTLEEIFADTGLDQLDWQFQAPEAVLEFRDREGHEHPFCYAIDLVLDLAALLLECKVSGSLDLRALSGDPQVPELNIRITASPEEARKLDQALADFIEDPYLYDLAALCPEGDLLALSELCGALREELSG